MVNPVTISVSGAGAQDTTVFRLRLASGTGNATFEDGTTQKSYTGNLSPTQLNIKGVTESSAANNYVMEALVNQTLHQPSAKTFTVAAITSLEFERINTTDVPFDNNPGTDGTHTTEEGLRVFPDKNTPTDVTDRATVRVNATIAPANVPNLRVYFASFDLDDPSAAGTPIDTTANDGVDNNGVTGTSKSGQFSNATGVTCANTSTGSAPLHVSKIDCPVSNNTTSANFQVTIQPGDNFAVAASLFDAYRNEVRVNTSAGANLINTASQVIPVSGEANPSNIRGIRTSMLTTWRRLHIEVDSMGIVAGNSVAGNFTSNQAVNSGNVSVTLNVSTLETNRFENGLMNIAGNPPFRVIDSDIRATPPITSNTNNSATIINGLGPFNISAGDPYTLFDDDDFNDNDGTSQDGDVGGEDVTPPNTTMMQSNDIPCTATLHTNCNAFAAAYIKPYYDLPGSGQNIPFSVNTPEGDRTSIYTNHFNNRATEASTDFWTVYLLGVYQPDISEDSDPDESDALYGQVDALMGIGAFVYIELNRPTEYEDLNHPTVLPPGIDVWTNRPVENKYTTIHEVGHLLNGSHDDCDTTGTCGTSTNDAGLMAQSTRRIRRIFTNATISRMRNITHP